MRKGQVKGRGLALPWAAGLVSFSGRGGGASASAVIAGLVDILTSADAVGHAANTVGRVASYPLSTAVSRLVYGEVAPKSENALDVLSDMVGLRRRSSGPRGGYFNMSGHKFLVTRRS